MATADVLQEISTTLGSISGISLAPVYVPEEAKQFPIAIVYFGQGGIQQQGPPELRTALHPIMIELHVSLQNAGLERAVEQATPYVDSIPNALFKALKDGEWSTIQTFERIEDSFGEMVYGNLLTMGWLFTMINVKTQTEIT